MGSYLYIAIAVAAAGFSAAALLRWGLATRIRGTKLLIGEAMRRRGITVADAKASGLAGGMRIAVKRCRACTSDAECRAVLSRFGRHDLLAICPNRNFFERIAEHKRAADAARTFSGWR
jgi:hypothetical protein